MTNRVAFVGVGNMGEAMLRGLLGADPQAGSSVLAVCRRSERAQAVAEKYGVSVSCQGEDAARFVNEGGCLVLAVKPKDFSAAARELCGTLGAAVVVSVVAGVTLEQLRLELGTEKVVRVMPNTPASVGAGISVWVSSPAVSDLDKANVVRVLSGCGSQLEGGTEHDIDWATALSGSGPAYVYAFAEALVDAGVNLGMSRVMATQLVLETIRGTALLAQKSESPLSVLREQVTSPGGTTARALRELDRGGFRACLGNAVEAAYLRCAELGGAAKATRSDRATPSERAALSERRTEASVNCVTSNSRKTV